MHRIKKKVTLINTIATFFLQATLILNNFIISKLILDTFGSDVNGLVSSLGQFLNYISLVEGGITGVIVASLYRPLAERDTKKVSAIIATAQKFYRRIGIFFAIYALLLGIVYPLIFQTGFSFVYIFYLVLILGFALIWQYIVSLSFQNLLVADKRNYVVSFTQALIKLGEIVLAIFAIKVYPEIHFLKLLTGMIFILQPIIYSRYVRKHYKIEKVDTTKAPAIKNRWSGFGINTAAFVHSSTDVAVLTIFTDLATVSVYSIYALVTTGLKKIINSLVSSLNPILGHAYAKKDFKNLNQKMDLYEYIVLMLVFFVFGVAGFLITPFVSLYTKGLTDANYYQPIFGILIVVAEALYLLKAPHLNLAYAANKFKEISKPAFIEAGLNIIISIILVPSLGLIGVTIGTIVAMLYRLIFHIYYTTKIIPGRSQWIYYRKITIFLLALVLNILICSLIPMMSETILGWILSGLVYSLIQGLILWIVSVVFFRKELKFLKTYLKK